MSKTVDIPVINLPFEAGRGFHAIVENGIAHVVVTTEDEPAPSTRAKAFVKKWTGAFKSTTKIKREDYLDDPRMLHYIDKYSLEG